MFTGIVKGVGEIVGVRKEGDSISIDIRPEFEIKDISRGDSISIDGVCLTVVDIAKGVLRFDISSETLKRSTLKEIKRGNRVNMEPAITLSTPLGGHLVTGHVDCTAKIVKKINRGRHWIYVFEIPKDISRYIIEKGSIAVDGISLTINSCGENSFEVNIIPETGEVTNILKKGVGDLVNIETDIIGKYVEKFLTKSNIHQSEGISEDTLKRYGYL